MEAASIWTKACEHLEDTLSKDVYERWIAVIGVEELNDDYLVLSVANDFYQSWLEENYLSLIKDAVAAVCGKAYPVQFKVSGAELKHIPQPELPLEQTEPRLSKKKKSLPPPAQLNPKYTFQNFVVGPSNNFAHAASLAVAQSPATAYNPLFIYGGSGLGKTHLMQAIGNHAWQKNGSHVRYLYCEEFMNEYVDALQKKALISFRKKYRNTDLLLIDDIHFLSGKEGIQEEFFHTFNALLQNHKQIVITCDRPASEIPSLEHRLVTRFEWGLVTELETPDFETRLAILKNMLNTMKVTLSDDILFYLAENVRSNIRQLEGALIRVASFASLTGSKLTLDTAMHLLQDTVDASVSAEPTINDIQKAVAESFDLRMSDMTSRKRPQGVAFPRQVAMYLCRDLTAQSLPSIGSSFNRNHATVLHACKLVNSRMKSDPSVKQTILGLRNKLSVKK